MLDAVNYFIQNHCDIILWFCFTVDKDGGAADLGLLFNHVTLRAAAAKIKFVVHSVSTQLADEVEDLHFGGGKITICGCKIISAFVTCGVISLLVLATLFQR